LNTLPLLHHSRLSILQFSGKQASDPSLAAALLASFFAILTTDN